MYFPSFLNARYWSGIKNILHDSYVARSITILVFVLLFYGQSVQAKDVIRTISLDVFNMVYDPNSELIYASLLDSDGPHANSIVTIDPYTGSVAEFISVGYLPGKLAISDNGEYLYIAIRGAPYIVPYYVPSHKMLAPIDLGVDSLSEPLFAYDIAVQPGHPNVVAVARYSCCAFGGVAIYANGIKRPVDTFPGYSDDSTLILFGSNPNILYGYNNKDTRAEFRTMMVDSQGVKIIDTNSGAIPGFIPDIKFANGVIYTNSGLAINPQTGELLANIHDAVLFPYLVMPDPTQDAIYYLDAGKIDTYRLSTFELVDEVDYSGTSDSGFIRWGSTGLAYAGAGGLVLIIIQDTDQDGIPDKLDMDDDNDGVADNQDLFPLDPTIQDTVPAKDFLPLKPGDSWTYQVQDGGLTYNDTSHVLDSTYNVSGASTSAVEDNGTGDIDYYTNDGNGILLHRVKDKDGQVTTLSPPVLMAPSEMRIGENFNSTGYATFQASGNSASLQYSSTTKVVSVENITVPAGTFTAVKLELSLHIYGSVNGQNFDETETDTSWLAKNIGPLKTTEDYQGSLKTEQLSSLTIDHDGDGVNILDDNCPYIANPDQTDTDNDMIGDACDTDDDNDGVPDTQDAFPLNRRESVDTDHDGIGNNADPDDDNDGMPDLYEIKYGLNPLDSSDANLDSDNDGLTNLEEFKMNRNPIVDEGRVIQLILDSE